MSRFTGKDHAPKHADTSPQVSVVVPIYNKATTVRRAIESALAQEAVSLEVIAIDDGSNDGSWRIIQAIRDPRIRLLRQANGGPGAARNAGLRLARARFVLFLDADDALHPHFLHHALQRFRQHPDIAAVCCAWIAWPERVDVSAKYQGLGLGSGRQFLGHEGLDDVSCKRALDFMHSSAVLVRTTLARTAGGFFDQNRCLYGEDTWLWLQILFRYPIYRDFTPRIDFHHEDGELGHARALHPIRPLLSHHQTILNTMNDPQQHLFIRLCWLYLQQAIDEHTRLRTQRHMIELKHLCRCLPQSSHKRWRRSLCRIRLTLMTYNAPTAWILANGIGRLLAWIRRHYPRLS